MGVKLRNDRQRRLSEQIVMVKGMAGIYYACLVQAALNPIVNELFYQRDGVEFPLKMELG
jgi:hypothetical protein